MPPAPTWPGETCSPDPAGAEASAQHCRADTGHKVETRRLGRPRRADDYSRTRHPARRQSRPDPALIRNRLSPQWTRNRPLWMPQFHPLPIRTVTDLSQHAIASGVREAVGAGQPRVGGVTVAAARLRQPAPVGLAELAPAGDRLAPPGRILRAITRTGDSSSPRHARTACGDFRSTGPTGSPLIASVANMLVGAQGDAPWRAGAGRAVAGQRGCFRGWRWLVVRCRANDLPFEQILADLRLLGDRDGVVAVEARRAQPAAGCSLAATRPSSDT